MSSTLVDDNDTTPPHSGEVRTHQHDIAKWVVWTAVGVVSVIGAVLRSWYLTHQPTTSDVAIVGLMARQILHGHFFAFYWGQTYGGAEPYVVALMFAIFGQSTIVLHLTSVLLCLIAVILLWRVFLRLDLSNGLALTFAAVVWIFPQVALWNSTIEYGFRGVLNACGVATILITLRMLDGKRSVFEFALLGLVVGMGWWASPEIIYFLVPSGLCFVGSIVLQARIDKTLNYWLLRTASLLGGYLIGALPWIWANLLSGFVSLKTGSFQVPPGSPGYGGRLRNFFEVSFPMQMNLREPQTGIWWHGQKTTAAVAVVLGLLLLGLVIATARKGGRWLAVALGVLIFPFALAVLPASWFWEDGRYTVAFAYLLALGVAPAVQDIVSSIGQRLRHRAGQRSSRTSVRAWLTALTAVVLLAVATLTTIHSFSSYYHVIDAQNSFTRNWQSPDAPTSAALSQLESDGIHDAYADYWVAYRSDFLGNGAIHITDISTDPDRWLSENRVVVRSADPAWLFVALTPTTIEQFTNQEIVGPYGLTSTSFEQALRTLGVTYRVVHADSVTAIIPGRKVSPSEVERTLGIPST